ncbi:MAG: hypothetical protein LRZ84_14650 [Desertifilum sp.]|nr:hypothetical protein [Desertifilum sp.]
MANKVLFWLVIGGLSASSAVFLALGARTTSVQTEETVRATLQSYNQGSLVLVWEKRRSKGWAFLSLITGVPAVAGAGIGLFQPDLIDRKPSRPTGIPVGDRAPQTFRPVSRSFISVPFDGMRKATEVFGITQPEPDSSGDWLPLVLTNEDGSLACSHIHICGPTDAGKTTLGNVVMGILSESRESQIMLMNPKHIECKQSWDVEPFIKSIKQSLYGLHQANGLLEERVEDPKFDPRKAPKLFIIVEEWDWIFSTYKQKAVDALRCLFKVGREVGVHIILLGQSPLATDTGLSGSDYRNFARIIIGLEATQFLKNSQFPYPDMKDELYQKAFNYQSEGVRFCLVLPVKGLPSIEIIPHIVPVHEAVEKLNSVYNMETDGNIEEDLDLPHPLDKIRSYCVKRDCPLSARDIQAAKVAGVEGLSAEDIRNYLIVLVEDYNLGRIESGSRTIRYVP